MKLRKLLKTDSYYPYKNLLIGKEFEVNDDGDCRLVNIEDIEDILPIFSNAFWFLPHEKLWDD